MLVAEIHVCMKASSATKERAFSMRISKEVAQLVNR